MTPRLAALKFLSRLALMMPRRVRRKVKVLLGRDVIILPDDARPFVRLGDENTWNVDAATALDADSVVYSAGIGWDISFDRELAARFGCPIHAFDPTPSSIEWLRAQPLPAGFRAYAYGLAEYDGFALIEWGHAPRWFQPDAPTRPGHPRVPVRRLASIMRELGHNHIDLLKIDIEGAEYAVIGDMLASGIRPAQLLIEYHHMFRGVSPAKTRASVDALRAAGYRVASVTDTGREFCFLHDSFFATHQ